MTIDATLFIDNIDGMTAYRWCIQIWSSTDDDKNTMHSTNTQTIHHT